MQLEIVRKGTVLSSTQHNGQRFVLAPEKGKYTIRLYNNSPRRRLAVVSVDGINILQLDKSGKGASYDGPGYVMGPWETLEIPGWRRGAEKVARFKFACSEASYASQMGRGENNVGVIGVAVFAERSLPTWRHTWMCEASIGGASKGMTRSLGDWSSGTVYASNSSGHSGEAVMDTLCSTAPSPTKRKCSTRSSSGITRTAGGLDVPKAEVNTVGTGYGKEQAFHTRAAEFNRATEAPALVLVARYATKSQFEAWGVPLPGEAGAAASAFPGEQDSEACPAPEGWRG